MKQKILFLLFVTTWLTACSTGQASAPIIQEAQAIQATVTPLTQGEPAPTLPILLPAVTESPASDAVAIEATATSKPTLAADAWKQLPAVPTEVSDAMRAVYLSGIARGNDPTHFSIIGDCQNVSSYFLATFEKPGDYSLGAEYEYLRPTIDYYQGSFSRLSLAVQGGYNAAAVISPLRADPKKCNPGESPLDCELNAWRPTVVFISMETWWSHKPAEEYDKYMRKVLDRIIEFGAVPIIATKADNLEGDHSINATIAQLAYEYEIPLWNFWAAVQPLPDKGLSDDGFHLTFARNFFDDPKRMQNAWPWRNLTALQALDAVRQGLSDE